MGVFVRVTGGNSFPDGGGVTDSGNGNTDSPSFSDVSTGNDTGTTTGGDAATDASFDFDGFGRSDSGYCFDDDGDGLADHDATATATTRRQLAHQPVRVRHQRGVGGPQVGSDGLDNDSATA